LFHKTIINMKKLYLTLIMLCLSANILAQTAIPPSAGDVSSSNPYQIATLENLYWKADNTANWSKHFVQTANINAVATNTWFSGQGWTPIGNNAKKYTGTYIGKNFTISDLWINRPATQYQVLFGYTNNSTIKNLALSSLGIDGGQYTGGLVGRADNTIVEIINVTGQVSSVNKYIGGMIGYASPGRFHYLSADVTITGAERTGGLIGHQELSAEIWHSFSKGSVTGTNQVGGLVGRTNNPDVTITDCYIHCNVS